MEWLRWLLAKRKSTFLPLCKQDPGAGDDLVELSSICLAAAVGCDNALLWTQLNQQALVVGRYAGAT